MTLSRDALRNRVMRVFNANVANGGTTTTTAIDTQGAVGEIMITLNARVSGTGTMTTSVTHSAASGSGYTAVTAAHLTNKDGVAASFSNVTTAAATQTLWLKTDGLQRYIRLEFATTFDQNVAVVFELFYPDGSRL